MSELIGQRIVAIRPLTSDELEMRCWDKPIYGPEAFVLELEDGSMLLPSRDEEGNGPGTLFLTDPKGDEYLVGVSA